MKSFFVFAVLVVVAKGQMDAFSESSSITASTTPMDPQVDSVDVKQYFSDTCEERLNDQIDYEFQASHLYLSMSNYLSRWDVALPGFAKKFRHMSEEEREHGIKIIDYIMKRGGKVKMPTSVSIPVEYLTEVQTNQWTDIMHVLKTALKMERLVNSKLVDHVRSCRDTQNYHMEDFIDGVFLTEQVDSIHELGRMITEIKMVGYDSTNKYGLFEYDKRLLK